MSKQGYRTERGKDKNEPPNPRRACTLMSQEDIAAGKKSYWSELEISGELMSSL